jgi:hypothetical protein
MHLHKVYISDYSLHSCILLHYYHNGDESSLISLDNNLPSSEDVHGEALQNFDPVLSPPPPLVAVNTFYSPPTKPNRNLTLLTPTLKMGAVRPSETLTLTYRIIRYDN